MATLPEQFHIAEAELVDRQAYVTSRTRSLIPLQRKLTGQAYDFRVRSTLMDAMEFKPVIARLSAIQRSNDTIQMSLPIYSESESGNKFTSEAATTGQYKVALGSTENITIGDFFTFMGHNKAYQVTDIVENKIEFAPNLVANVTNSEVLIFNGMKFSFYLQGRPQRYSVAGGDNLMEIELDLVERWI